MSIFATSPRETKPGLNHGLNQTSPCLMVKLCQATMFGWLNFMVKPLLLAYLDQSCWTNSCPIHVSRIACPFKSTLMVSHGTITTRRWTWRAKKLVKIDHRTIGGFEHGLALSAGSWHRHGELINTNPLVNRFYVHLAPPWFISVFCQMAPIINYFA